MKSKVSYVAVKPEYPMLKRLDGYDVVLYMLTTNHGFVVHSTHTTFPLGLAANAMMLSNLETFDGTVTLQNA